MAQYSIKDLEKISGIKAHTIRIWEKRYQLLQPQRTETNIRFYTDDDLRKILNVSSLVKGGMKISRIANLCNESVRDEVLKIEQTPNNADLWIDRLIRLMIDMNTLELEDTMDAIIREAGIESATSKILFPFLKKIGLLWQVGSVIPIHEHFVSNLIRQKLIGATNQLPRATDRKTVLFFLKEDERHELGLLFFQYLVRKKGYTTIYLGGNVPFSDLTELAQKYDFDIAVTTFINALKKEELEDYLGQLSNLMSPKKILISGQQVNHLRPALPDGIVFIQNTLDFMQQLSSDKNE